MEFTIQKKNRQINYLDKNEVITEKTAVKTLKKTCLVLRNSEDVSSNQAWEQFQQIFNDMKIGTDVVDVQQRCLFLIIIIMKRLLFC